MGTKNNPDDYDCYAKLAPDEPYAVLAGHDLRSEISAMVWSLLSRFMIERGLLEDTPEEQDQISSMMRFATEAKIYSREYHAKKSSPGLEYDQHGYPTTGPHAGRGSEIAGLKK